MNADNKQRSIDMYVDGLRHEEKALVKALRAHGLHTTVHEVGEQLFSTSGHRSNDGVVSVVRIPGFFKGVAVASALEATGAPGGFPRRRRRIFGRKSTSDMWLAERGLPGIPAYCVSSRQAALQAAEALGYPVVLKPDIGGFGRRVHLINNADQLDQVAETVMDLAAPYNKFLYVQKYKPIKHDLRVLMLFGQVLSIMERCNSNSFSKNISLGGYGKPAELGMIPAKLTHKLQNCLSFGLFGVDILIDTDDNAHVCEINANCQFREFTQATGIDAGEHFARNLSTLMTSVLPQAFEVTI